MKEEEMRSVSMFAVVLVVGVWLAGAPAANAGEWTQVTCTQPGGQPAPVEGWQGGAYGGYGPDSGPSNTCAQPGGALTAFDSSAAQEAAYTGPMWTYTAPGGSTIAGGSLTVSLSTPQGQAYVATPKNEYSAADVLVNCQFNEPCATGARAVPIKNPGGTQLFMVAECVGPTEGATTCPAGSGGGVNAEIKLSAADVELANSSTPTGTSFAGSLLAPAASGKASLTFSAQDPEGPGVYRVIVEVDGTVVYQGTPDSNGGKCASIGAYASGVSEFLSAQPCKRSVAVDVPVATTRFSNGQHTLKVTVQDAAANPAIVYDGTISIANAGASSIGPGSPLALRGAANGANASDQATLTARWARTNKEAFTSRYGAAGRVVGHLTSTAGEPITAASIDVYETPAYHGAGERRIASVSTGSAGQWILTLPRNISSCVLHFAYRSHINDTVAAAIATLKLSVRAGILLSVTPRSASVGRKIFFSGVLHGVPVPEDGKQLVLEARAGREWIQFDTIHTNAKGRYRASYRFKFPGPVIYRFRIVSPHEADFPFLEGASNIVTVHER